MRAPGFDLQSHSLHSDGELTAAQVVENAAEGPTGLRVDAEFEAMVSANPLDISTGFDEVAGLPLDDFNLDDDYLVITDIENAATVLGPDARLNGLFARFARHFS